MSSIKRILEKNFFGYTFKEIKEHIAFKKLKLTDEEIINNRTEIKQAFDSQISCGSSFKFCSRLEQHYSLKRNSDQKLVLTKYQCNKAKNFKEVSEEEINKQIQDKLYSLSYNFNYKQILKSIETIENMPMKQEILKNLGNPNHETKNKFNTFPQNKKKEIAIISAFHEILLGNEVALLTSSELKEICVNNAFQFKKEKNLFSTQYQLLKEIHMLIIIDLGLEGELAKHNFYLDIFPVLLLTRNNNNKYTQIFTPLTWNEIKTEIENIVQKNKKSPSINKHKMEGLDMNLSWIFFNEIS